MASREQNMVVSREDWLGTGWEDKKASLYRKKKMAEARSTARKHLCCVSIVFKSRLGFQVVGKFDARFWLFDPVKDVDLPPPDFREIKRRQARAELTKKLNPPKGLFG